MMIKRRRVLALVALFVSAGLLALAGWSYADRGVGKGLRQHARAALARHDAAVGRVTGTPRFVPIGELTGQIGEFGDSATKDAFATGHFVAAGTLPSAPYPHTTISWADGTSLTVPVLSAEDALAEAVRARFGACAECLLLQVTGARLITTRVSSTRGEVAVPTWEYTLSGTALRMTRVAVDGSATVTASPPPEAEAYLSGEWVESATTTRTSNRLIVGFTGAQGPGSEPCGMDYDAEAIESANAVVVVVAGRSRGPFGLFDISSGAETCLLIGYRRTATVTLTRPLGERAVLDVHDGQPVPVTIDP